MSEAERFEAMLLAAFRRSDALFSLLDPGALMERPIALRHPFLFYVGHLPAFAWNQIGRGALGQGHLHPELDIRFERGIDAASTRAASISSWPPLDEVLAYRDEARGAVLARLPEVLERTADVLCARGRVLHLVVEHELMHHETLLYMLQEQRPGLVRKPESAPAFVDGDGRAAEPRHFPAGEVTLGVDLDSIGFGWDNEIGHAALRLPAFTLDSLPVRNVDYLAFLDARGAASRAALTPRAWTADGKVTTVLGPVPFALASGWPVQVTGDQARAYCASGGGRLPSEAELCRAAFTAPRGGVRAHPWGDGAPEARHGNFGFQRWSPVPVGSLPEGASAWGVEELVGNGWEWTQTPFGPLPGFTPWARTYPGYSADFFDGEHDVVFGASWATDEKLLRPSFGNWYRRDYPYVFSSFRGGPGHAGAMIRSRIHLIGGGPGTMLSLRRHLRRALSEVAATKKPLVAYVGAADGDRPAFQQMIGAVVALAGGRMKAVKLASPRAKVSAAQGLLEDCDVVFVSGGDVDAGMNVLHERGVLPVFHALGREGRPMIGISAGSIMLGRAWVRFPEADAPGTSEDTAPPQVFQCMGLAPVYVDAHAEDDAWGELRVLLHVLGTKEGERAIGYGLTRKGGVCVEQGKDGASLTPFGTSAPRFVFEDGNVVEKPPLALGSSEAVAAVKSPPRRRAGPG